MTSTASSNRRPFLRQVGGRILATLLATGLFAAGAAQAQNAVLRIGYQKYGTLTILKGKGDLEKRLAPLGVGIKWVEFPAGPQLLEGLNVGSIDFGTVGEAPPIFAQAAGADIVYVANQPPAPTAEAIVVPKGSPIKSVAELRGKKVVLNKGSNVHYLLVKALEKAGLQYSDVQVVFLPPADARAAFERGSVDAWAIWDPFLAAAEKQIGARVIANGKGIVSNHQFYLASRKYANQNPGVIKAIVSELQKLRSCQHGARLYRSSTRGPRKEKALPYELRINARRSCVNPCERAWRHRVWSPWEPRSP